MSAKYYPAPGLSGFGGLSGCPPGQVQDYDPATGQYLPGCVDWTEAYGGPPPAYVGQPGGQPPVNVGDMGTVNVNAGPQSSFNSFPLLLVAGALFVWFVIGKGK